MNIRYSELLALSAVAEVSFKAVTAVRQSQFMPAWKKKPQHWNSEPKELQDDEKRELFFLIRKIIVKNSVRIGISNQ